MAEVAAPEGTTLLSGSGHIVTPTVARTAPSRRRSRQHQQLCADDPLRRCLKCPNSRPLLAHVRQAVETSFSQLWYKFLDRVFSRSWRGLWNTVQLKFLHYNLRHAGVLSA